VKSTWGKAVLVHTRWDRHWRTERYGKGYPFLTAAAARHLVDAGAALVCIDSLNTMTTATARDLSTPPCWQRHSHRRHLADWTACPDPGSGSSRPAEG